MGNNEVVGPYGPGTVFQQWARRLAMVRFAIGVKSTRVGQLLGDVIARYGRDDNTVDTWHGMEMFLGNEVAEDDPRLSRVYDNFQSNLTDICARAQRAGAAVILSTVAVNLKDCPPLASLHRADLSPEDLARWESLYRPGVAAEASGDLPRAIELLERGGPDRRSLCGTPVSSWAVPGGDRPGVTSPPAVRRARNSDALRFRADSRINAIIREVAEAQPTGNVLLVDAEQALAKEGTGADSIPGEDLFYEHVHLTFEGNYLLGPRRLGPRCGSLARIGTIRPGGWHPHAAAMRTMAGPHPVG